MIGEKTDLNADEEDDSEKIESVRQIPSKEAR